MNMIIKSCEDMVIVGILVVHFDLVSATGGPVDIYIYTIYIVGG